MGARGAEAKLEAGRRRAAEAHVRRLQEALGVCMGLMRDEYTFILNNDCPKDATGKPDRAKIGLLKPMAVRYERAFQAVAKALNDTGPYPVAVDFGEGK